MEYFSSYKCRCSVLDGPTMKISITWSSQSYICIFEWDEVRSWGTNNITEMWAFTHVHKYGCTFVSTTPSINTLPHLNWELIWIEHAITFLTHIIWASERFALRSYRCFKVHNNNTYINAHSWLGTYNLSI